MTIKAYLRDELRKIGPNDLLPDSSFKTALWTFFTWAALAILFVGATSWLGQFKSTKYLTDTISEGIGPHLWNVVGTFGCTFLGALVIAPKTKLLAILASEAFANTYVIGALSFGLLAGQVAELFITAPPAPKVYWLYAIAFPILFAALAALNLSTWYLSYLSSPARLSKGFLCQLAKVDMRLRLPVGLALTFLPLIYAICQR
ncbi:hypothetical protein ACS7SF_22840 (plasmid) [Ralstonia sp. 25C]|uniref:hypothetical protein n=1 Tax=Ralstonia sp. 25C TaxID=3447363 RepID=UPI003F750C49